jgi:hypothetical protein
MPTPMISSMAEKMKMPVEQAEGLWEEAKKIAEGENKKEDYAYITSIFEKMCAGKNKKEDATKSATSYICKSNAEKQIVYGVVLDPYGPDGDSIGVDSQNDWTPPAEVEKAAHAYMQTSRLIDKEHMGDPVQATVVESWLEPYESVNEYKKAMAGQPHRVTCRKFGDDVLRSGSWVVGMQLPDDMWKSYLDGELNAFSPHGTCDPRQQATTDAFPKVEFIYV